MIYITFKIANIFYYLKIFSETRIRNLANQSFVNLFYGKQYFDVA